MSKERAWALCSAAALLAQPAGAASSTTTFQVTANVAAACTVTASNLDFGTVNPLGGAVDQSAPLTVACTSTTAYTVGLSAGTTTGSTLTQRLMASGASFINYNLYTDAARGNVWGNSAASPSWVSGTGSGLGTPQTLTVYGRIPSQPNLAAGSYLEPTISVTVTY
jgi:spore coat protein U-like protein